MNLFGKKRAAERVRPVRTAGPDAAVAPPHASASHLLTLDVSRAMDLAVMLANSRASRFIEIPDVLAGLYMYEWDRLAAYWPEENRERVQDMLQEMCQISPQRWNYWIQLYDTRRKESEPQPRWKQLGKAKKEPRPQEEPIPSVGLKAVFQTAEVLSPFRDPRRAASKDMGNEDSIPVLTAECLVLAIAKYTSSETARKLRDSGLDILQMERAVLDPKRSPLR
jgi:hypothetical protein